MTTAFVGNNPYQPQADTPKIEEKEFIKDWLQWATDNRIRIIHTDNDGTNTYSVPEGHTLYITSARLSANSNAILSSATLSIGGATIQTLLRIYAGNNAPAQVTASYSMPIKVVFGEDIQVVSNSALFEGGFVGFLVQNS